MATAKVFAAFITPMLKKLRTPTQLTSRSTDRSRTFQSCRNYSRDWLLSSCWIISLHFGCCPISNQLTEPTIDWDGGAESLIGHIASCWQWWLGGSGIIGPISSIRYGRSWNSSASTQGVIRPWRFSPPLVHILLAWSSPLRPMRVDQVGAETRALRRTSRVGPWADPFPAIHGGLDTTADWTPWPEPTSIRRWYPGLWFVSAVNSDQ